MCFFASELEKFALKIAKLPRKTVADEVADRYSRRLLLQRRVKPGCGFASNTAPLTEHNADHDLKQCFLGMATAIPSVVSALRSDGYLRQQTVRYRSRSWRHRRQGRPLPWRSRPARRHGPSE